MNPLPSPESASPAATSPCRNCGEPLAGAYCHACGQRHRGRLTLRGLWQELVSRFFNLERGLVHTFLRHFTRPGEVSRAYVQGRRRCYVSPLAYFLVAATIQLLSLVVSGPFLQEHLRASIDSDPAAAAQVTALLGDDAGEVLGEIYLSVLQQAYTYLAVLFMAVPLALLLRFLVGVYNLAETLVFSLYTVAHVVLITGLFAPILVPIHLYLHSLVATLTYPVYAGFAAVGFYGRGWRPVALTVSAVLMSLVVFFVGIMTAFAIAVASHG